MSSVTPSARDRSSQAFPGSTELGFFLEIVVLKQLSWKLLGLPMKMYEESV